MAETYSRVPNKWGVSNKLGVQKFSSPLPIYLRLRYLLESLETKFSIGKNLSYVIVKPVRKSSTFILKPSGNRTNNLPLTMMVTPGNVTINTNGAYKKCVQMFRMKVKWICLFRWFEMFIHQLDVCVWWCINITTTNTLINQPHNILPSTQSHCKYGELYILF